MRISLLILACFVMIVTSSCSKNPYVKNVSHLRSEVSILPFHTEIRALAESPSPEKIAYMHQTYGPFFESYNVRVMNVGLSSDSSYINRLQEALRPRWIQELYADVEKTFSNIHAIEEDISEAFAYYRYYFPDFSIPKVASFISGVNLSIIIDEDMIAIGLDKYLGERYPMYRQMGISQFLRREMHKDRVVVDCMIGVIDVEFPYTFSDETLLSYMLHHGRQMYLLRSVLPEVHDTILWAYTRPQLEFCKASEAQFWKYMVSENVLFSTDYLTIKRFVDKGPFTHVFTRESPGRVGQWMGFNIIESFMNNNSDVSLSDLMVIQNPQDIMSKARYRPR